MGDKSTENEVLLLEHDIPHSQFSEAVLDCLPKLPWIITSEVRLLLTFKHEQNFTSYENFAKNLPSKFCRNAFRYMKHPFCSILSFKILAKFCKLQNFANNLIAKFCRFAFRKMKLFFAHFASANCNSSWKAASKGLSWDNTMILIS